MIGNLNLILDSECFAQLNVEDLVVPKHEPTDKNLLKCRCRNTFQKRSQVIAVLMYVYV